LGIKTTPTQIVACARTCGRPQPSLIESGGGFQHFEQGFLTLRPLALLRRRLGHGHADFSCELLDRRDKVEIVGAHDKPDRVAVRAATKAMKKKLVLDHIKGRRLFVVERTQTGIFAPAARQFDSATNQPRKRNPATQLVEETGRKGHSTVPSPPILRDRQTFLPSPSRKGLFLKGPR